MFQLNIQKNKEAWRIKLENPTSTQLHSPGVTLYSKFVGEPPETISICKYTYIQVDF